MPKKPTRDDGAAEKDAPGNLPATPEPREKPKPLPKNKDGGAKKPPKSLRTHPDARADFKDILSKYIDDNTAKIIADHVAATGSDNVFEEPVELIQILSKFPQQLPRIGRKQFLDHWIALNKIVVPEDYDKMSDKSAEAIRSMKTGENQEKFAVNPDTGNIRLASTTDARMLTHDEAKQLSDETKKALAEQKKQEAEAAASQESGLARDEHGDIDLNPKAKTVTLAEAYAIIGLKQARAQGDTRSTGEIIAEKVSELKLLGPLAGLAPVSATPGNSADSVLATVKTVLEMTGATNKGTDPAILARMDSQDKVLQELRTQNATLQQQIQQDREKGWLDKLDKLEEARKADADHFLRAIEEIKKGNRSTTELGVLQEALAGAREEAKGVRTDMFNLAQTMMRKPPKPMTSGEHNSLMDGIGNTLTKDAELDTLAKQAGLK